MTREEAWRRTKGYLYDSLCGAEADAIIEALEQESCEDMISRQAVLNVLAKYDNDMKFDVYSEIFDNINKLPSINQDKTGHWIDDGQYAEGHSDTSWKVRNE